MNKILRVHISHPLIRGTKGGAHITTISGINVEASAVGVVRVGLIGKFGGEPAYFHLHVDDIDTLVSTLLEVKEAASAG